jgi:hypothetical protein
VARRTERGFRGQEMICFARAALPPPPARVRASSPARPSFRAGAGAAAAARPGAGHLPRQSVPRDRPTAATPAQIVDRVRSPPARARGADPGRWSVIWARRSAPRRCSRSGPLAPGHRADGHPGPRAPLTACLSCSDSAPSAPSDSESQGVFRS